MVLKIVLVLVELLLRKCYWFNLMIYFVLLLYFENVLSESKKMFWYFFWIIIINILWVDRLMDDFG